MKRKRIWLRKVGSCSISKLKKENALGIYNLVKNNQFLSLKDIKLYDDTKIFKKAGFIKKKPDAKLDHSNTNIEIDIGEHIL